MSPSAVVVAKTKEDLPKIFNRFGIDLSKAENVKQALSILWNRYEKNEFYLEVNEKKHLIMHVIRLDIFVQRAAANGTNSEIEVVVETYSQTNDERLCEMGEVPHKILRKNEPWQRAIRKIAADLFVVDEEDMKLLSFDQKMERSTNSEIIPGLRVAQHDLRAFVNVQGLPPTSKFHTVQTIGSKNAAAGPTTVHHYFEWMDIRKYFVQRKEVLKNPNKRGAMSLYQSLRNKDHINSNIQVDPFGRPLTDEQGFPLSPHDPRRILVEQLVQKLYEGCESLLYSVLASSNSLNCLLQVELFDKGGTSQEMSLCKIGTAKNIIMECTTFNKLDAFCPENVPQRDREKPLIIDSMGGVKLRLANANWVKESGKGAEKKGAHLVSTLGDVISWESDRRLAKDKQDQEEKLPEEASEEKSEESSDDSSNDNSDSESVASNEIWDKNFELDDYFAMDHLLHTDGESRPFGDAMKAIGEVFGEILAQLSMTTATPDPSCDLVENYQILHLLKVAMSETSKVTPEEKTLVDILLSNIQRGQKMPSTVQFYAESPVVGPTPENFHDDSILLDSSSKLWFAGDTGKFVEKGHVFSAICKFEVLIIIEHLKLPVTIDDINSATGADQISDWLTVSREVALAIINGRNRGGKFHDKEELLSRVSATTTAAVKEKLQELLLTREECNKALQQAKKLTAGLMGWHDIRRYTKFKEKLPSRMEFVWELVTLLRRKLLLYRRGKSYTSQHHKTGLLSFFLRSCLSKKRSGSQRQVAYNAALQLCRTLLPDFSTMSRPGGRHKSNFWGAASYHNKALTEDELQMELVHYKIDCAAKYSNVIDSLRHKSLEVMRHHVCIKKLNEDEKEEIKVLHGEVDGRRIKDQLYGTSHMRHLGSNDDVSDEGVNVLLRELFPAQKETLGVTAKASAAKLYVIGPSKSGKTLLCKKLVIRILASKQIKRDFGVVPVLINVTKLVANYFKELEDREEDNNREGGVELEEKEEEQEEDGRRRKRRGGGGGETEAKWESDEGKGEGGEGEERSQR